MSEHDDIDFDFFGDSAPEPPKKRLVRRPSGPRDGGGSPPPRHPAGPPHTASPIVRLVSLIAFAIALILILIFAVRSCETSSETAAYKNYMDKVSPIATDSQTAGTNLSKMLDRQNLSPTVIDTTLKGLIRQQAIDSQNAAKLVPPGPLREQNAQLLESLQLRSSALSGLLTVFKATQSKRGSTEAIKAGAALSKQMLRGVASDVLWEDMFAAAAQDVMKREGISGVSPPKSVFVSDPTRATVNSMANVWQTFHGVQTNSQTSGTIHGTNIAYVKVFPSGDTLTEGVTKTITANERLRFVVGVQNGGDFQEQNIKVTLKISQKPDPIVKVMTIGQIYSHATAEVTFKDFAVTELANVVPISVDVTPVTGETNKANNQATYEVRFSF
ncbi:MAG: CARDB domain-containing protein [Gaiellaceae bacterium]